MPFLTVPAISPRLSCNYMSVSNFGAPAAALALAFFAATAANIRGDGVPAALLPAQPENGTPTFADRVAYQNAIENVYWRYRIWPKERQDSKPPLSAVMSPAQFERKVKDYLHNCQISGITSSKLHGSKYRRRWSEWRSTRIIPGCCASYLMRWAMIRLSSQRV